MRRSAVLVCGSLGDAGADAEVSAAAPAASMVAVVTTGSLDELVAPDEGPSAAGGAAGASDASSRCSAAANDGGSAPGASDASSCASAAVGDGGSAAGGGAAAVLGTVGSGANGAGSGAGGAIVCAFSAGGGSGGGERLSLDGLGDDALGGGQASALVWIGTVPSVDRTGADVVCPQSQTLPGLPA
jgi:hypothetical protein